MGSLFSAANHSLRRLRILSVVILSSWRWHSSLAELLPLVPSAALGCAAERRKEMKGFKVGKLLFKRKSIHYRHVYLDILNANQVSH